MFCFNIFDKKPAKEQYAVEAYRKIPTKDLREFNYRKSRLRYQKGYRIGPSQTQKLNEFVRTKPQLSVLYQQRQVPQMQKIDQQYFLRKILKSEYQELKEKYGSLKSQKYTDKDFPPSQNSIGKVFNGMKIQWKRIPQIIKDPMFICDTVSPEDVFQGELGNCYFLSAISALAEYDFRIKNIFGELKVNPNGFYMARIMFRGVYQEVVVDDFVPVGNNNYPLFAKPTKKNEIWVMILEKCWAKLFGSYQNTISGFPNEVLHAFSSAPTFQHKVVLEDDKLNQLFDTLIDEDSKNSVMCCGTISDKQIFNLGLINDHAYSLLQVYKRPYHMVKLRNPWGNIEWNGRASKYDSQFWKTIKPYDKVELGYQNGEGGTFFMLWDDFIKYFKLIDICKIQDNANYFYIEDSFSKEKGKIFQFETKGGEHTIAFSQTNLRGNKDKKIYGRAILILGRIKDDNKVQVIEYKYVTSNSGKNYADFYLHVKNIDPGSYKIYAEVEWETQNQDVAVVSVYTEARINLREGSKKLNEMDFLSNVFIDHASKNAKSIQYLSQDPLEYICYDLLINNCGYGYVIVYLSPKSKKKLGLEFNEKDYNDKKLKLLNPYAGKGKFKITVEPGKTVVVLYKMTDKLVDYPKEFMLPIPKIYSLTK